MRSWWRFCWRGACLGSAGIWTCFLWTLWLALSIVLAVQLYVLSARELSLPGFLLRELETRLATSGLRAEFGQARFDPSGRIFIRDLRLWSDEFPTPLATIDGTYVRLDPWALLVRHVLIEQVEVFGVDLSTPAMLSPSGQSEAVIAGLAAQVRPEGSLWHLDWLTCEIGALTLSARGAFHLPSRIDARREALMLERLQEHYFQAVRALAEAETRLEVFTDPRLELVLRPHPEHVARVYLDFTATQASLPVSEWIQLAAATHVRVDQLRLQSEFPLLATEPSSLRIDVAARQLTEPSRALVAGGLLARIEGPRGTTAPHWTPQAFDVSLPWVAIGADRLETARVRGRADASPGVWQTELTARAGGEAWTISARGDPRARSGQIEVAGRLSPALLAVADRYTERDLGSLLQFAAGPEVELAAGFAPGGRLEQASGRLAIGPVTARDVSLDAAHAQFRFDGREWEATDIHLLQGENEARGRYWMDADTREYRFLLTGHLRPPDIAGWFKEWWTRFWEQFDFSAVPPIADVEVHGRWGDPTVTRVFVGVDSRSPVVRDVPFDHVRTRLFIRPHFYDALDFNARRADRSAHGQFTRAVDLEKHAWRYMEFTVWSDLDLDQSAQVLGPQSLEFVAPYRFETPPDLFLRGRLDGPASEDGEHQRVSLTIQSRGPFRFHDFPLSDLVAHAEITDDEVTLNQVSARFAGGSVQGRAQLSGPPETRRLGFDYTLNDGVLGEAIKALEDFGAVRRKTTPEGTSRFQQQIAQGRLDLAVSAEGNYLDLYSYRGAGHAELTGADLGEIKLLGLLTELLRGSLLKFTSLKLDSARANFSLDGEHLAFSELSITGPSAAIEAQGNYLLREHTLDMKARIYPFRESDFLLSNAMGFVLTPLSSALEFRLNGTIDKPTWAFVYGPTSFLRALTGESSPGKPAPPPAPYPYLRRTP